MESTVKRIQAYKGSDGQFYWRGIGANGEGVIPPEGHTRIADAVRAANGVFPGIVVEVTETEEEVDDDGGT